MQKIKDNLYKISNNEYLTTSEKGSSLIYPIKKDLTKPISKDNINWYNLLTGGSYKKLINIIILISLILFITWSYANDTKECRELIENPSAYFEFKQIYSSNPNLTELNLYKKLGGDNFEYNIPVFPKNND